jgi:DNA-binding protein HU-beta
MTKAQLIDAVAAETGLARAQAARAVDGIGNVIACTLVAGQDVAVPGLGKFRVKEAGERRARNPLTGEQITVPPRRKVVFKPSGTLKDSVK